MALMIFMQKWCWFHFPKYYSFILHYFFYWTRGLHPEPALLPAALPRGLRVWSRAAGREEGEGLQPPGEDAGRGQRCLSTELDPTCSRPAGPMRNQSTLDKGTGRLRPRLPRGGLEQQKQREAEPWMEWNGSRAAAAGAL